MNRRHLTSALALFVLAALAAGLYAASPKTDGTAGTAVTAKAPGSRALEQQVRELQSRITSLEQRIKKLEQRPAWTEQIVSPSVVIPNPIPGPPETENDGFPPARFLLIDGQPK